MPEIWIPYGPVEVAVNLKAENLGEQIAPRYPPMNDDLILKKIGEVEANGRTCLFTPRPSGASIDLMKRLIEMLIDRGVEPSAITVSTAREYVAHLRKTLAENRINLSEIEEATEPIGKIDGLTVKIPRTLKESETRILLTDVEFDPLFGFAGGPVALVRRLGGDLMAEAFRRRGGDLPTPGVESDASSFAGEIAGLLGEVVSIEVLSCGAGVSGVFIGDLIDAHRAASARLLEVARIPVADDLRVVMVSAGGAGFDSTLAEALRAVWNVSGALGDKGLVALVAECSDGLGSESLVRHISRRLDLDSLLRRGSYLPGLEDLLYIRTALRRYTVVLVSALPDYYTEMKMGFHPCRKIGDALSYILSSLGSRTKVHIIPHGASTLLSKGKR